MTPTGGGSAGRPADRPPFESLGAAESAGGMLRLWRRWDARLGLDVYEVKLGDEYLMTSLFPDSEIALTRLGLDRLDDPGPIDVCVGGLGLGFTALEVLADDRVAELVVVEYVAPLIDWHREGLVPASAPLVGDPRTRLVHADFFAAATSADGLDPALPGRTWDALLVDIDHTPTHHLDDGRDDFYTPAGMAKVARNVRPGGVFALWSDGLPLDEFTASMATAFDDVVAEVVTFDNVLTGGTSHATIYLGTARP